jgi:hypothetical protein
MIPSGTMASGIGGMFTPKASSKDDNGIWTNKLILGMAAQPVENLVFKGALGSL